MRDERGPGRQILLSPVTARDEIERGERGYGKVVTKRWIGAFFVFQDEILTKHLTSFDMAIRLGMKN